MFCDSVQNIREIFHTTLTRCLSLFSLGLRSDEANFFVNKIYFTFLLISRVYSFPKILPEKSGLVTGAPQNAFNKGTRRAFAFCSSNVNNIQIIYVRRLEQ